MAGESRRGLDSAASCAGRHRNSRVSDARSDLNPAAPLRSLSGSGLFTDAAGGGAASRRNRLRRPQLEGPAREHDAGAGARCDTDTRRSPRCARQPRWRDACRAARRRAPWYGQPTPARPTASPCGPISKWRIFAAMCRRALRSWRRTIAQFDAIVLAAAGLKAAGTGAAHQRDLRRGANAMRGRARRAGSAVPRR